MRQAPPPQFRSSKVESVILERACIAVREREQAVPFRKSIRLVKPGGNLSAAAMQDSSELAEKERKWCSLATFVGFLWSCRVAVSLSSCNEAAGGTMMLLLEIRNNDL